METVKSLELNLLGQRALAEGFKIVDLYAELKCAEIEKMEIDLIVQAALEQRIARGWIEGGARIVCWEWDSSLLVCWYQEYRKGFFSGKMVKDYFRVGDVPRCQVETTRIQDYVFDIIPESVLERVHKGLEIGFGLHQMVVAYPVFRVVKADPIVAIRLTAGTGDRGVYLKIGAW